MQAVHLQRAPYSSACITSLPPTALPCLPRLQEELASLQADKEADAAEYERRLQEAVDSAEKWKQFAEGVQAQAGEFGEQLASVQAELQVRHAGSHGDQTVGMVETGC